MFSNQVKIMLYVNNVEESSQFWQIFDFIEKGREEVDGTSVVEIVPSESAGTIVVLHDLALTQKHSPEMVGSIPPLVLAGDDIIGLYKRVQEASVTVGEAIQLPTGLVSNFADNNDNYFTATG